MGNRNNPHLSDESMPDRCAFPLAAEKILHLSYGIGNRRIKPGSLFKHKKRCDMSPCQFLGTCVGCGQSGRQSRYCGGHPSWREARTSTHAGLWVDAALAPVTGRAEAHARTGAVRRWWWKRGAKLGLVGAVGRLWMLNCFFVGWRAVEFRSHFAEKIKQ